MFIAGLHRPYALQASCIESVLENESPRASKFNTRGA
jgi:hypothetical protein